MYSNLSLAVADVLAANQEVKFLNVLTAYVRVAGFKKSNPEALTAFERAMDKHPDCKDQVDSESAKAVAKVRHEYWKTMFDWGGGKQNCCPCCVDLVEQYVVDPEKFEEDLGRFHELNASPPLSPKKPRRKRQKNKKLACRPIAFDPYGPSTSASHV
ncbi:hypothetical protein H0H93_007753 [Arthromyces matolae]|nr:hypothetical protein H0H93_007753 [Arthromyces matolae]